MPPSVRERRPFGVQTLALGYRTGAAWNETHFSDPVFDAALETALGISDPLRRRAAMAVLQARLRASGVIVQPYWRALYRHARPGIVGAEMHPKQEINPHRLGWETAAQAAASMAGPGTD